MHVMPTRAEQSAIRIAPWGVHTRYLLGVYLKHVFMVSCALLAIALTIDIWPQFQMLTEGETAFGAIGQVARFAVLRSPDLLSPLMPFAIFLGVVWSEIVHTQSGERMLIWNSGRSHIQCLAPAVALGIILGLGQFLVDGYLGAAAMGVQMHERLGKNGIRLDRARSSGSHWISSPDGLIRTEVTYGPPTVLRNLTIYTLDTRGGLSEVESAASATPLGNDRWLLENGHYWLADILANGSRDDRMQVTVGEMNAEDLIPFTRRIAELKISPLWLSELGIEPQYLSLPVLRKLSHDEVDPLERARYRTRVQTIYADIVFPGLMAVLAALLSIRAFAYRTPPRALILVLLAGYLAHFANKAFVLMGQNEYTGAIVAAWMMPAVVLATIVVVISRTAPRRPVDAPP